MTQTGKTIETVELTPREKLVRIMKKEQAKMIRQVLSHPPENDDDKRAFEYLVRQMIVKAVADGDGDAEVLLRTPKPLKSIYYEYKYYFDGYLYEECDLYVHKAIEDCVNNTLRKEFLRGKGWDAPDEFDIHDEQE